MPQPALSGRRVGFHGKIPALGDFVTRGLPRDLVDPWHAWLESGVAASREALGDGWFAAFLTAPVWRFALPAGACGPEAVAGVLIPSVDKVGRYFPFTLAATAGGRDARTLADGAADWYAAAEALALRALAGETAADLVLGLGTLPVLDAEPTAGAAPDAPALWWTDGSDRVPPGMRASVGLPTASAFASLLDGDGGDWNRAAPLPAAPLPAAEGPS